MSPLAKHFIEQGIKLMQINEYLRSELVRAARAAIAAVRRVAPSDAAPSGASAADVRARAHGGGPRASDAEVAVNTVVGLGPTAQLPTEGKTL